MHPPELHNVHATIPSVFPPPSSGEVEAARKRNVEDLNVLLGDTVVE